MLTKYSRNLGTPHTIATHSFFKVEYLRSTGVGFLLPSPWESISRNAPASEQHPVHGSKRPCVEQMALRG